MASRILFARTLPASLLAGAALLGGCGLPPPDASAGASPDESTAAASLGVSAQALGELIADRPSYVERVALYACDRARVDPAATGWAEFPPVPPLLWADEIAQAARAHSEDMRDTPCFQHKSCDGTETFDRVRSFLTESYASLGENIAAGTQDPEEVIQNWIDEVNAAPGETGHRENMFEESFQYVGFGFAPGGTRYNGYYTQDFGGKRPAPTLPHIPAGAHVPESPTAGSTATFGAIYYDAAGAAPDRVEVVIDGVASPLVRVRGADAAGAYEAAVPVAAGCHRYFFRTFVGGVGTTYPDGGTLGVGTAGTASCATFQAGGVGLGGGEGGCSVAGKRGSGSAGGAILSAAMLALALFRRRRAR